MPPNHAGSNNLYSLEFYELIRSRLAPGGAVAQWLPFHLLAPDHMRSIAATFRAVFPYTRLWIDPASGQGVLVGSQGPWVLKRTDLRLPLSLEAIERGFALDWDQLEEFSRGAELITDDNQLLSYGYGRLDRDRSLARRNRGILERYRQR